MYKELASSALILLLCSCGTIKSLNTDKNEIAIHDSRVKTHCTEISRIYSGVQYDLCLLDSETKDGPPQLRLDPLWLTSVDILFSSAADTILLPYTLYQQSEHGNLSVNP
jgi:uncharacterized protein YceK